MRPHIVGIAGPSSSGKSELARQLCLSLPGTSIVSLDSYYRAYDHLSLAERTRINFDHPDSLDWELLHEHLSALTEGRAFEEPVYSFAEYTRLPGKRIIEPHEYVIVEGLFVFYWAELRNVLNTRIFVQTGPEVCFQRRLKRDVAERGRTAESVREQYARTVLPGAEWFVNPTKKYADLVVSGEESYPVSALGLQLAARASRERFARSATAR